MAVSEEGIQYWMKRLPPPTPEQQRVINYYRELLAQQALREDAGFQARDEDALSPTPKASAPQRAPGEATGPFKQ